MLQQLLLVVFDVLRNKNQRGQQVMAFGQMLIDPLDGFVL